MHEAKLWLSDNGFSAVNRM
uniref:Uncharacterized protein n=1 Tax=Rhizophora mucronata TaxID=61149 RepID=A0A2P2PR37_RHIMU